MGVCIKMVDLKVPRTVKIGVTGTSKIKDETSVRERVKKVLLKIDKKLTDTPYHLVVISPLAQGADRIVADEIIKFRGSKYYSRTCLDVILQNKDHKDDSPPFNNLIDISSSTRTLDEILEADFYKDIAEDYTHAGQLVVDECDFLIAVWDENETKEGDTAHIVKYARLNSLKPLFIINPTNYELASEVYTESFFQDLEYHNTYNQEYVDPSKLNKVINEKNYLLEKMDTLKLDDKQKDSIKNNIFLQQIRANQLAMYYQRRHYLSINLVYYFSAAAVAVVTFQLLFLSWIPEILIAEAIMMLTIIILLYRNRKKDWHRKWIDYRYLAERLRAATIFSMAGLDCSLSEHLPHQRSGDDWTLNAYQSVYQKQMKMPCPDLDFKDVKNFVLDEWIRGQKKYYKDKSEEHHTTDKRLYWTIGISFGLAALGAFIHAFEIFWPHLLGIKWVSNIITFAVIFLPALGASCAGIRIQHEYLRISRRYIQMVSYLQSVEYQIEKLVDDKDKLVKILEKANKMMLREHQDWRAIFSVRDAELP